MLAVAAAALADSAGGCGLADADDRKDALVRDLGTSQLSGRQARHACREQGSVR